jgi:hypothetical protein
MKNISFVIFATLLSTFTTTSCMHEHKQAKAEVPNAIADTVSMVNHGKYLVEVMGCHDCHSPKRMGPQGPELIPELILSGYPGERPVVNASMKALPPGWAYVNEDLTSFTGPWGRSFAANITSDPTGIGNFTEEQFRKAFTEGKFMGVDNGRMLLPPMPWQNFIHIKEADLKAIYLYLKSTNPVKNIVPGPIPPNELP